MGRMDESSGYALEHPENAWPRWWMADTPGGIFTPEMKFATANGRPLLVDATSADWIVCRRTLPTISRRRPRDGVSL